ncbi:RICIN domain-containing protein [Amycolatopsis sp. CA-126428]|uniref:RICIN domain-containing protein n=1 Tax=Amycolatopsis sp. CA-126428 TaxID=2073158 RepID=UPI000CD21E51|nr:ricin-type beta-trefoil lectin domain protein [Amycolatopsis sp. CA-126428]
MRKRPFLTALGSIAALAASMLAFPTAASAANPGQISNPMQSVCLQPENGSTSAGALILQAPCNGSAAQRWTRDGLHYVNLGSGLCLNAGGERESGHILSSQWPCNAISNENWQPASSVPGAVTALISRVSGTSNTCLELPGGFPGVGNAAWLSRCNGSLPQQWLVPSS